MSLSRSPQDRRDARILAFYERNAGRYDRQVRRWERLLFWGGREWVCSQARGEVLELGVGTGRNFSFYPEEARITGVDLSPAMLEAARSRAASLGREVELRLGDAQGLLFGDASFDTLVSTLTLCTVWDPDQVASEAHRVLRPAGSFLLLEHVRSLNPLVRAAQRMLDPLSVRLSADHLTREPVEHLRAAGFVIERLERSKWGIVERVVGRKAG